MSIAYKLMEKNNFMYDPSFLEDIFNNIDMDVNGKIDYHGIFFI